MQFNVLRGFLVEEHATRAHKILLSLFRDTLMIKENVTLSSTKEGKIQKTKQNLIPERDSFNQSSDQSDREKWSTSKGGPVFSETFPVGPNRSIEFWTEICRNFGSTDLEYE